jgi:hypothetical protein
MAFTVVATFPFSRQCCVHERGPVAAMSVRKWGRAVILLGLVYFVVDLGCADPYSEPKIAAQLERLADGQRPERPFTEMDFICFAREMGSIKDDLRKAGARKSVPITETVKGCGEDGSCCNLDSNVANHVGLVRGSRIRCVRLYATVIRQPYEPDCIAPAKLRIRRIPYDAKLDGIYHPDRVKAGVPVYGFGEGE